MTDEKIFQADLRLLELESRINKALRDHDEVVSEEGGDPVFLIVFAIEDIMSDYSDWVGNEDHLYSVVDQIIGRIYARFPYIEDRYKHTAFSRIIPDNFTTTDIPARRLVSLRLAEVSIKPV